MTSIRLSLACVLSLMLNNSQAALLLDWSPDTVGASMDCCIPQNNGMYLQKIHLSHASELTGFVYYNENNAHNPAVGDRISLIIGRFPVDQPFVALVNLRPIVSSNQFPGATASNYGDFYGITGIFADLPSIALTEGDYLIGYNASTGFALLTGSNAPSNNPLPLLDRFGNFGFESSPPRGTMSIRLYGDITSDIPAPATVTLLVIGLLSVFATTKRQRVLGTGSAQKILRRASRTP